MSIPSTLPSDDYQVRHFVVDKRWRTRPCPACTLSEARWIFEKEGVRFVNCNHCGTCFVDPLPPTDLLNKLYEKYGATYFTQPDKVEIDFQEDRYRRELRVIPNTARSGRILDVGCSTGSFLKLARLIGFDEVRGIDVSAPSVEFVNAQLGDGTAIAGDFTAGCFPEKYFDVVTIWATLEHVPDPEAFLKESHRVLRVGGLLCVSVPNRNALSYRVLGKRWSMVSIEHLNYFSKASLIVLLKRCGFSARDSFIAAFNPINFVSDVLQNSIKRQANTDLQIQRSQRVVHLRGVGAVSFLQNAIDAGLNMTGSGDLLILSARNL